MKKVLFATTALVATAGFASADVALSGNAQMGVQDRETAALVLAEDGTTLADVSRVITEEETQFIQDIDVTFTLSGETPGGITFGAAVDLDENAGAVGTDDAGVSIFISGDFGTLTMGDTDGGFDAGMQEVNVGSPGSINDDETSHAGYNGNGGLDGTFDGQILSYSYSISGFTITGSVELDDTDVRDAIYGLGASYTGSFGGGSYTIGAGYQVSPDGTDGPNFTAPVTGTNPDEDTLNHESDEDTVYGISATVSLDNGLSAGVTYSEVERENVVQVSTVDGVAAAAVDLGDVDTTHFGIGASYTFGDITVHANYGEFDSDLDALSSEGFGLAASYDFGGGLSAHLGYGHSDFEVGGEVETVSVGLNMAF
jgi:outer membrane protein OmpU